MNRDHITLGSYFEYFNIGTFGFDVGSISNCTSDRNEVYELYSFFYKSDHPNFI